MLPYLRKPSPLAGVFSCAILLAPPGSYASDPPERGKAPPAPAQVATSPSVVNLPSHPEGASAAGASAKVLVRQLNIKGNTRFSTSALLSQTRWQPNQELDLAQLQQLAQQIQAFYHEQGYFLARAYLPPQHNTGGSITIEILEARYGKVDVNNPQGQAKARHLAGVLLYRSGPKPRQ
ncbi:MAG: hypothetical protein RL748_1261 [Pseudomonadota bacterium]